MKSEKKFMEYIKIAEVLQREFKDKNLSVSEAARRCGIPTRTLNDWFTGKTLPSAKTLGYTYALAEFLKISLHHLLFNVVDKETNAEVLMSATFKDGSNHYRLTIEKMRED